MFITECQMMKLRGAMNTLTDLAESVHLQDYQRGVFYFLSSGIEALISEIENNDPEQIEN